MATNKHWYPRYTGDYARDTAHLSMLEHGAYVLLLDHYYSVKQALPANAVQLHRICRAVAQEERDAVDFIIREYFHLQDDGYHNSRADKELEKKENISKKRTYSAYVKHKKHHANAPASAHANAPILQHTATSTSTDRLMDRTECVAKKDGREKNDFQKVYDLGSSIFPNLAAASTQIIRKWLEAGCIPETDIIPEIQRQAGRSVRSWSYFTGSVMDAKATRLSTLQDGVPNGNKQKPTKDDRARAAVMRAAQAGGYADAPRRGGTESGGD